MSTIWGQVLGEGDDVVLDLLSTPPLIPYLANLGQGVLGWAAAVAMSCRTAQCCARIPHAVAKIFRDPYIRVLVGNRLGQRIGIAIAGDGDVLTISEVAERAERAGWPLHHSVLRMTVVADVEEVLWPLHCHSCPAPAEKTAHVVQVDGTHAWKMRAIRDGDYTAFCRPET